MFFIVPKIELAMLLSVSWLIGYASELLLGVFPAYTGKSTTLHDTFAFAMGVSMTVTTFILAASLGGTVATALFAVGVIMLPLIPMAYMFHRWFIFFELLYIYLSHTSILIAIFALN